MEQAIKDNAHFIYFLFNLTAAVLVLLSKLTGLSYQFWNIIIWFAIMPAMWIAMIGKKTTVWLNVLSIILITYLFALHTWDIWFNKAALLLNKMATYLHSDYKGMSVYVCVFLPITIFIVLGWFCLSPKIMKRSLLTLGCLCVLVILLFPISNLLIKNLGGHLDRVATVYNK